MASTILAVVLGLTISSARGGRFANLASHRFESWPLLVAGGACLALAEVAPGAQPAFVLAMVGSSLLISFCLLHLRFPGLAVVAVGLALNAAVLAANGTTPVSADALVASGVTGPEAVGAIQLGSGRALARSSTVLADLGRTIPVRPMRAVVSFGDLILCLGLADAAAHLLRAPGSAARRRNRRADTEPRTLLTPAIDGWDEGSLRSLGDAA